MDGLSSLRSLESLWLGKNKIESIEGICELSNLRQLDVQNNRLVSITGINDLIHLEELYLASNAITSVDGIPTAGTLSTIDLSRNKLSNLAGIEAQIMLEDLWLSSNQFETFDFLEHVQMLPKLTTIYLEHNPISRDYEYRMRLSAAVPSLEYIDATMTTAGRQKPVTEGYSSSTPIVAPPGSTV